MKRVKRRYLPIVLAFLIAFMFQAGMRPIEIYAAGGIGITDELDGLDGDGKYLAQDYRDNYRLDVEKLGMTDMADKVLNSMANVIFSMIHFIGFAAVALFYYAMDFDLAALLQPQIDAIQETLHASIFLPMLQLVIACALVLAVTKYARRDFVGLMGQFGKVIIIIFLSFLVVRDSATFLTYASSVTKSISVSILTGVSGTDVQSNVEDYAAGAAGVLWVSLVHEPWKSLEFGSYSYDDEDVDFFLTASTEEKERRITELEDENPFPFSKDRSAERIGQGIIIFLTMIVKCGVYIVAALMYLVFQVIAIFFIVLAPVILLLCLVPGYDFDMLSVWARKIIETQIGVLLITFVIGIMVLFDLLLQSLAQELGWFVVLVLQITVCVALYLFRWKLLMTFNNVQRGVQNPNLMKRQMIRAGNPYTAIERNYMYGQVRRALGTNGRRRNVNQGSQDGRDRVPYIPDTREIPERREYRTVQRQKTPVIEDPNRVAGGTGTGQRRSRPEDIQSQRSGQNIESGIKSERYYAPREVTDNWRDIWDNSMPKERPKTTDNSRTLKLQPSSPAKELDKTPSRASRSAQEATRTARGQNYSTQTVNGHKTPNSTPASQQGDMEKPIVVTKDSQQRPVTSGSASSGNMTPESKRQPEPRKTPDSGSPGMQSKTHVQQVPLRPAGVHRQPQIQEAAMPEGMQGRGRYQTTKTLNNEQGTIQAAQTPVRGQQVQEPARELQARPVTVADHEVQQMQVRDAAPSPSGSISQAPKRPVAAVGQEGRPKMKQNQDSGITIKRPTMAARSGSALEGKQKKPDVKKQARKRPPVIKKTPR